MLRKDRVEEWIDDLDVEGEELEDNLKSSFRYVLENVGEISGKSSLFENIPYLDLSEQLAFEYGVRAGVIIQATSNSIYEVQYDGGFVSCYSMEEANKRAEDLPSATIRSIDVEPETGLWEVLDEVEQKDILIKKELEEISVWVLKQFLSEDFDGVIDISESPVETDSEKILFYSIMFGVIVESENPSVYVVHDNNSVRRAVHMGAEEEVESGNAEVKWLRDYILP